MVLRDELFEWFYDEAFPPHVRLNNISGGTDIAGCFGVGNPLVPVYVGGCAGCSLGIPVEVYDSTIEGGEGVQGVSIEYGVPGELVATAAFPNMPTKFWGDTGKKYHDAYFGRFNSEYYLDFAYTALAYAITKMYGPMAILFRSIRLQNNWYSMAARMGY